MTKRSLPLVLVLGAISGALHSQSPAATLSTGEPPQKYYCIHNGDIYGEVYGDIVCPPFFHDGAGEPVHVDDKKCILSRVPAWMIDQRP